MPSLPTGTVTFLFTDIEGSTALLQRLGDRRGRGDAAFAAAWAEGRAMTLEQAIEYALTEVGRLR